LLHPFYWKESMVMQQFSRAVSPRWWLWCAAALALVLGLAFAPAALLAQDDVLRPAQSDPAWRGEYFANRDLSRTGADRADADINSAGAAVAQRRHPNDRFSVR
jgi:hypothetical protein